MSIGLKYQGHGVSDKDVWTINSYYRISDERGDRKRRKLLGYTNFCFVYSLVIGGEIKKKMKPISREEENSSRNYFKF